MKSLASMLKDAPGKNNGQLMLFDFCDLKSRSNQNPYIMGCSLMRSTHNKNFMILVRSVHKTPPMGQSVGRKSKVPKGTMALYGHHQQMKSLASIVTEIWCGNE
jgi:hypothetical protein